MLFASLVRLLRRSARKSARDLPDLRELPQLAEEHMPTERSTAPVQIVPLVTGSMHELSAQRPTITVWIGDASYQAMVV